MNRETGPWLCGVCRRVVMFHVAIRCPCYTATLQSAASITPLPSLSWYVVVVLFSLLGHESMCPNLKKRVTVTSCPSNVALPPPCAAPQLLSKSHPSGSTLQTRPAKTGGSVCGPCGSGWSCVFFCHSTLQRSWTRAAPRIRPQLSYSLCLQPPAPEPSPPGLSLRVPTERTATICHDAPLPPGHSPADACRVRY